MNIRNLIIATVALTLFAGATMAQSNISVAKVNTARVFSEMQETKDLKVKLEQQNEANKAIESQRREQINQLRQKMQMLVVGSKAYRETKQQLLQASIDYRVWTELTKAALIREQKAQMVSLFGKIEGAVEELAKQRGIDLVLSEINQDIPEDIDRIDINNLRNLLLVKNVLFVTPKLDLTDDVIALLDKKYREGK